MKKNLERINSTFGELDESFKEINKGLKILIGETIFFTVLISFFLIGATVNAVKQLNDFNAELDAKMAQIEAQCERIISR